MATTARTARPADYNEKTIWEACARCSGTGQWAGPGVDYTVMVRGADGTIEKRSMACFGCHGTGGKHVSQAQLDRREADRARRERKRAAEMQENLATAEQNRRAFFEQHPALVALEDKRDDNRFASSLCQVEAGRSLSEKQLAAAEAMVARDAERAAEAAAARPVVEGRQVITGEILSVKVVENDFGGTIKMTVRDDRGFRVFGTMPGALAGDHSVQAGARVELTATVKASDRDKDFGFFSRPAKASVLA